MIDDPLSLLSLGIWLMAAGMYPLGFLFGACSECCNQCNNFTCDGFDLEEAFGPPATSGRFSLCFGSPDGIEVVDGKLFLPGYDSGTNKSSGRNVSKGCRVFGEGIAPGAVVTDVTEVQDPPKQPYVLAKRGCCEIVYDQTSTVSGLCSGIVVRVTERVNRTEQQCDDREAALLSATCQVFGVGPVPQNSIVSKSWTECVACDGGIATPATISGGIQPGASITGLLVTVSPAIEGEPPGCISFCGSSGGICGISSPDETYSTFDFTRGSFRRNCIRWVCRCYEGTGKKNLTDENTGEPLFPNPSDWYTVASTTAVGGPTTNNLDLGEVLSDAEGVYGDGKTFEQEWLFEFYQWSANEEEIKCLVWPFVFYGRSFEPTPNCEVGKLGVPKTVEITDEYYTIGWPCDRCQ